ncbi:hypothetical protein BE11_41990 [Sorangium cellulosum]|nr:hypothetical protein BE11_41990 [Sorangium cellulosum]
MSKDEEQTRSKDDESTRELSIIARALLDATPGNTRLEQLHNLQRVLGASLHAAAGHPDLFRYYREVLPEGVVRSLLALAQLAPAVEAKAKNAAARRASDVVDREAPTLRKPTVSAGSRRSSYPPRAHCVACSGETFCITNTDDGARLSCVQCGGMYPIGEVTRVVTVPDRTS